MTNIPPFSPLVVAVLIFPGFQLLDAAGPVAAFEMPNQMSDAPPYRLRIVAMTADPVASSSGVVWMAEAAGGLGDIDTLVVAGGQGTRQAATDPAVLAFIREAGPGVRRLCSVCSGAYILAAAGVLDGRRAATHWGQAERLSRLFPKVKVEPDSIYVRDGSVWTSAGVTAGIDLALALIADDLGEEIARRAAQELVVYHRRPGGQSQFSALLEFDRQDDRFSELLAWVRGNLRERHTIETLAVRLGMSERSFVRRFTRVMATPPARAVERLRMEAARVRIEAGADPVEQIARETGFGDPERMRRAFVRNLGQPPQALRRAARSA